MRDTIIATRLIERIPEELIEKFLVEAVHVSDHKRTFEDIVKSDVKIGAFDGEKLIGFTCGKEEGQRLLSWIALYVPPSFRRRNVGQRLAVKLFMEARKRGFEKVEGEALTRSSYRLTKHIGERMSKRLESSRPFKIEMGGGFGSAKIDLKTRRKM